ncbi:MAG: ATP-binding protein [Bacteroidia bacterium]
MSFFNHHINRSQIITKYFSDDNKKIVLEKGQILLNQNESNNKLFYIKSGKLVGFIPDKHATEPVFKADSNSFVGVYSFFSQEHLSYSKVVAAQPTIVFYYNDDPNTIQANDSDDFVAFLFSIAVAELKQRQGFAAELRQEQQNLMNKLIRTEKLATLGQLSAGLAHELNNAIGALTANLRHLQGDLESFIALHESANMKALFDLGFKSGQTITSKQERDLRKKWPKHLNVSNSSKKRITKAGIDPNQFKNNQQATNAANLWNLGNTLHDMEIASNQAAHVIGSIKSMGIANQNWHKNVDVNKTILEALAILRSMARQVVIKLELDSTTTIEACHGELVQVWVNLLKNAIESLLNHPVKNALITIKTQDFEHSVVVSIKDNGVGIAPKIIEKIFEPNFTTKVAGISLGLGVGLTIVQRIIDEHNGDLSVESHKNCTIFSVQLQKELNR